MGTSNKGQVGAVSESAAKSESSFIVDFSSEGGVLVSLDDSTGIELDRFSLLWSVGDLSNVVVTTISVDKTSHDLAQFDLSLVFGGVFNKDLEILLFVTEVEVVSGEGISEEVDLGSITELEFTIVEDNSAVEERSMVLLDVESQLDVGLTSLMFEADVSAELLESGGGLNLGSQDNWLPDGVGTEVTPKSESTLVVELGFNTSAFDVSEELNFR